MVLTRAAIAGVLLTLTAAVTAVAGAEDFKAMRDKMVEEIKADMRRAGGYVGNDEMDPKVVEALKSVERHRFVPEDYQRQAYVNSPLPIGSGQTISQPFIVGLMTDLLDVDENDRVLELGTGSGYQAAVLAEIVDRVFSIEIVESLARAAAERLEALGYDNVEVRIGDGTKGWPEQAPFDGIIVTAAGIEVPPALKEQLKPGGRMVIPVGGQHEVQQLMVITRSEDGSFSERRTLPVRFVPITGPNSR